MDMKITHFQYNLKERPDLIAVSFYGDEYILYRLFKECYTVTKYDIGVWKIKYKK